MYPASITPFDANGQVDLPSFVRLAAWFRSKGCAGIVVAGTNGEGPSLSAVEKRDLVKTLVPIVQMPVILGIATASLEEAVWSCRQAHSAGAEAALVMAPGYFREADDEGISRWFEALLARSPLDVLVYNFPKRTGITLSPEVMARLAQHDRMIGLKDSSGDASNIEGYAQAAPGKILLTGNEPLLLDSMRAGWSGTISGASNALPGWLSGIVADWAENRESAETKFALIQPALGAVRNGPQPMTNKEILRRQGVIENAAPRLPLLPVVDESVEEAWTAVSALER